MAIRKELSHPYEYERNPDTTDPKEFLNKPELGGNCELMAQAIVSARGYTLPRLRSSEIYTDMEYTKSVKDLSKAETGDLIGLRPVGKKSLRGIHVGVIWVDYEGEIHVVHSAKHLGFGKLEPLGEAMHHAGHEVIAWIKRPIIEDPSLLMPEKLTDLGLEQLARQPQ